MRMMTAIAHVSFIRLRPTMTDTGRQGPPTLVKVVRVTKEYRLQLHKETKGKGMIP